MAGPWDQRIRRFAAEENLDEATVAVLERFLDASMRMDTIEVSMGGASMSHPSMSHPSMSHPSMSDHTTQAFTTADEDATGEELLELPTGADERYLDVGRLGLGGMGEVRRVRDGLLNRFVAMKILRPELAGKRAAVLRFIAESQATAQLQHPGAVPVHDMGQLSDGRWYFTMKELRGQTLEAVISEHRVGRWERGLRGLVEILARIADTIAYAHDNGALHRDLKPANVLVGAWGEVIVLDWGLVKASGTPEGKGITTDLGGLHTRLGAVIGTPSYMPPEQAEGRHDTMGPTADVYALGAILYEMLSGRRPYEGEPRAVLDALRKGPPPKLPHTAPPGLVQICERAMARDPKARFDLAEELAHQVRQWLDGAARKERAAELVRRADALKPVVENALDDAVKLQAQALTELEGVASWAPVSEKVAGWRLEDAAMKRRIEAELAGVERLQLLRGALTELPGFNEAEERLAYVYHFCHARAERAGDVREAAQYEALLRSHDTGSYADYLAGRAAMSLRTRPPGAKVTLQRFSTVDRRMLPGKPRHLGTSPMERVPIGAGSYLLRLEAEGREPVLYPVSVGRSEHWHGREPGGRAPAAVYLPEKGEIPAHTRYVPAGWTLLGPRPTTQVWVDGFVIQELPVTVEGYLEFLNSVAETDPDRAHACQPRLSEYVLQRVDGRYVAPEHRSWQADMPVTCVSQRAATDYAIWYAGRTGEPWRLPWEAEWEKAARGVDGRQCVMGEHVDPAWAEIRDSSLDEAPKPAGHYAEDCSVYGVRDLTGGVGDWCADRYDHPRVRIAEQRPCSSLARDGDRAVMRGGFRTAPRDLCQTWFRHAVPTSKGSIRIGFRLARSIEAESPDPEFSGLYRLNP